MWKLAVLTVISNFFAISFAGWPCKSNEATSFSRGDRPRPSNIPDCSIFCPASAMSTP